MLLLLFLVGTYATPAPTVPTPFPTITPAPKSACTYADDDQGPFALDCLQEAFIDGGCRITGESYPTETELDDNDGSHATQAGDDDKRDKEWYNQQTWKGVKDEIDRLKTAGLTDCRGPNTNPPTPDPTAVPTSKHPTAPPTPRPTTETPAPTYNEDDEAGRRKKIHSVAQGGAITNAELKTACLRDGFGRQYDDTQYVLVVEIGASQDFYTTTDEICDIFDGSATATVGNRPDGPFQDPAGRTHVNGGARLGWETGSATAATNIYITSFRVNPAARERVTPWSNLFAISMAGTFCQAGRGDGMASTTTHCTDNSDENQRQIALALANRLFEDCSSTEIFRADGGGSYSYNAASTCWDNGSGAEPAYVAAVRGRLATERCPLTSFIYYSDTESCLVATAAGDANAGRAACTALGGTASSVNSKAENQHATEQCGAGNRCYLGNQGNNNAWHSAAAQWDDGNIVDYNNFYMYSETDAGYTATTEQLDTSGDDGRWKYNDGTASQGTLCRKDSDEDNSTRHRDTARSCSLNPNSALENYQALDAGDSFPKLNQAGSGFLSAASPGELSVQIDIPKQLFDVVITFENSTNDDAEYDDFNTGRWTVSHDSSCATDATYQLAVPWTVFNLGGAGGIQRLVEYKDSTGQVHNPDTNVNSDGSGAQFIFGSTIRVSAKQPLRIEVEELAGSTANALNKKREAYWDRKITVRIPVILKFQKTVTVSTQTDIVSTKFNYKTVAALIQSIQYETQYFAPPYAKIKLRIRTKSQFPYMFYKEVAQHTVSVGSQEDTAATVVNTVLTHLADDANCTFTNPDHMREGDVCVQEWQLDITPDQNVCYATGEYTITYETRCFYGKDVCYMPFDSNGDEMNYVSFTFKIQTSKFCPEVADEIQLGGELSITGRESFKPTTEGVEGATVGDWYLQGETVHVLGKTSSTRAKIISTNVIAVEVHQDLSGLVQTGFNRVPFDPTSAEMVLWTDGGSIATGTVTITADGVADAVTVMSDADVYPSGTQFDAPPKIAAGKTAYEFTAEEAGFKILLHARVFPVNTDSFGTKKFVVTMQVQYEAIGTGGGRRRRLLSSASHLDNQQQIQYSVKAWEPKNMPSGLHERASMALTMSVQAGTVSRANALQFAQSVHTAIVSGLNRDPSTKLIYDEQVSIDAIHSGNSKIWSRPQHQAFGQDRRRIVAGRAQTLKIEFTFVDVPYKNSMEVYDMMKVFEKQLKSPASPLLSQPIFRTSVIHELEKIDDSNYKPTLNRQLEDTRLVSGASALSAVFGLVSVLLALL